MTDDNETQESAAPMTGPRVVCCVCSEPCSIFAPVCPDCMKSLEDTE